MKKILNPCLVILAAALLYSAFSTIFSTPVAASPSAAFPPPAGPYLGQSLPAAQPRYFANFVISGDLRSAPVFTPEGDAVYWSAYDEQGSYISAMSLTGDAWSAPDRLLIADWLADCGDPYILPDGSGLIFSSTALTPGQSRLWVADRQGDAWVSPRLLPDLINDLNVQWSVSAALSGDLYFSAGEDGFNDLYVSRVVDGRYTAPQMLPAPVNTPDKYELTPAVAPDGSYLIFARMSGLSSRPRLYITYHQPDDTWSNPALIKSIDTGFAPALSLDGKYLFYLDGINFVSWVDTTFVRDLLPQKNLPDKPAGVNK